MSGIFGYVKRNKKDNFIVKMKNALIDNHTLKTKTLIDNEALQIASAENELLSRSFASEDIFLYIYGEIYSHENIQKDIFESFTNNKLPSLLATIDGHYTLIIYDKKNNILNLATDRYGLKPIFIYQKGDDFAFSPKPRGVLALDFVDKSIGKNAFDNFTTYQHFLSNDTWNSHIKLLPPATLCKINLSNKSIEKEYYWSWNDIEKNDISFEEAYKKLGKLFIQAVDKRFDKKEFCITLSGGRDSRLIAASLHHLYPDISGKAITFGPKDCDDVLIAKEISKRLALEHIVYELDNKHWFFRRIDEVAKSDGLYSMMHFHSADLDYIYKYPSKYWFNGFGGDYIFGNEITQYRHLLEQIPNSSYADHKQIGFLDEEYLGKGDILPFLIINGGRRFNYSALMHRDQFVNVRFPFMDNDVLEFIYSLPLDYRLDGKIYAKVALEFFPNPYKDIPWQRTRKTLDGRTTSVLPQVPISRGYMNYAGAIREESILKFLYETLEYKNSLYKNYTDIDVVEKYLQPHIDDMQQNHIVKIFNFLTAELYLRELHK